MGLQFILGRAGTEKSHYILEEIKEKLKQNPKGPPIIYIVPEQMTFQQEYTLFKDDELPGSIRAQVFSFSRLAWRILSEVGGGTKQFISSTGIQMMLRKIIEQRDEQFNVFQRATEKQGFIEELERIITEFKRHCITPHSLGEQISHIQNTSLTNKLTDIHYIFDELSLLLQAHYMDGEDQLQLLADKVNDTTLLHGADIYIDGFHRFTPIELQVIGKLLQTCDQVTVSLTTDAHETKATSELDLFYQTTETYKTLKQLAQEVNISIDEPIILEKDEGSFANRPYFNHLETYFDVRPAPQFNYEAVDKRKTPFQVAEAIHPRAEIEGVAQQILKHVREGHYRYKDIAIFIRESKTYEDLIATVFEDFNIPVFIDEERMMLNHPLIEFIRSLFDMVESQWRYDTLFRVLKTGLIPASDDAFPLTNDAIDKLENYVLEFGIRRRDQWKSKEPWVYNRFRGFSDAQQTDADKEQELEINAYREQVVRALSGFDEAVRQAKTNRERCEVIFNLLEQLNVPMALEKMRTIYDEEGHIEKAREQEQVWNALIQLFDEFVEIIGEEEMSLTVFRATLEAGFESLKFSHVPPSMDHVIVGTIDHSRIASKKCTFLLGVNEGVWPMAPPVDGIINEEERELLKVYGMELAESSRRILLDDWFYMYLALTRATDYLWISYPISDEEGEAKTASQVIRRLYDLFPLQEAPLLLQDPDELIDAERFITTPVKTRAALTAQLSRYLSNYPTEDVWWHVLNWYISNESKNNTTYNVLQSLFYENIPVNLSEKTVEKLHPKQIKASVSRLEMYYRCSYQHYLQYGLGLEERRTYKLDAPDIGQLFHEALKTITQWIKKEGRSFADLTQNESNHYAQKSVTHLAPILQHQILSSSRRYKYIQRKLQDVIARATFILSEQARLSGFSPIGIELGFGLGDGLDPIKIALPNDYELILRGRIDRVDQAFHNDELYLRIIDYKSSSHALKLLDVYYGIALQMLAYLNVILSQSEDWLGQKAKPAGVLYFHMHNKELSRDDHLSNSDIADEIFKEHKMDGLLIAKSDVVKLMDTSLESGYSQIVPAALKRDGEFYSNAKVADQTTFQQLQEHIYRLIRQAGIQITTGDISLNPYEYKDRNACTFCSFKSVCQFDPILQENNFRQLIDLKDDEILERMVDDESEEGTNG